MFLHHRRGPLVLALLVCLAAAGPSPAEVRQLEVAIDVKDVGKRAFSSNPLVWVDRQELSELVSRCESAGSSSTAAVDAPGAPLPFSAVAAAWTGRVEGELARFEGRLRYHLLEAGPHALPLAYDDVAIESIDLVRGSARDPFGPSSSRPGKIGEEAPEAAPRLVAPSAEGMPVELLVEGEGEVEALVRFSAPVTTTRGRSSLTFRLPPFAVKRLSIALPEGAAGVTASGLPAPSPASPVPAPPFPLDTLGENGGGPVSPVPAKLELELGSEPAVQLQWYTSGSPAAEAEPQETASAPPAEAQPPRISARSSSLFVIGDELLSVRHEIELLVTRGRLPEIEIQVPHGLEVSEVGGPLVADWRASASEDSRRLSVRLREPLRGETSLVLTGHQTLESRGSVSLPFPRLSGAGVPARQQGVFGISSYSALALEATQDGSRGVRAIDPGELPPGLTAHSSTPILLAYRCAAGVPAMSLGVQRFDPAAVLTGMVENANAVTILTEVERQAGEGREKQVTSFTKVIVQVANASRKFLKVRMEPEARITSCSVEARTCSPAIGAEPGEFLIPLPRSRVADGKLQAYPVQLTYQLDLKRGFESSGSLAYRLPSFDVPVADYSWKVFTPEKYRFIRFQGDLHDTSVPSEFIMVRAAKWLFDRLLYDFALRLLVLLAVAGAAFLVVRGGRSALSALSRVSLFSIGALAVSGFVILALAAISVPNFRAARERSNVRACFANQKTIAGAIEMYNLDFNTNRRDIGAELLQELVEGGYLQTIPQDPGQGPYSATHYHISSDGEGLACRVHGAISGSGARVYGYSAPAPAPAAPDGLAGKLLSKLAPGGAPAAPGARDRTNPINFRIPRTGQYTLLLRGYLSEGVRPGFTADYQSVEHYSRSRALCWIAGLGFALFLMLPAAKRSRPAVDVTALGGFLALLMALDAYTPALATEAFVAWTAGMGIGMAKVLFGARISRLLSKFEEGGDER